MFRTRRAPVNVAVVVLVAGLVAVFARRACLGDKKWGDIGGLELCDERAALERRPQRDKTGCFVFVPAGEFLMGAQSTAPDGPNFDADADADEGPPHRVRLAAYLIQKEEVSVAQYQRCREAGGCAAEHVASGRGFLNFGSERRLHPVNGVSWAGAAAYCRWIDARLPTEAEWEFAARGTAGHRFPWGDQPADCNRAVMNDPTGQGRGCGRNGTTSVNDHPKLDETAHMLLHVAGNVWEWVDDWYAEDWYARAPADGSGPATGERKVQRGGGWTDDGPALRTTFRGSLEPASQLDDLGFRCAVTAGTGGLPDEPPVRARGG